jgi:metal-dependent amidase/aminoacylase/carboxypeptidase family protein
MMFLGGTHHDRDARKVPANHSSHVVFDEEAMVDGVTLYSTMALRHLGLE